MKSSETLPAPVVEKGETLSADYIMGLRAQVDELRRQWDELPAQIERLQKRYEAALLFAPPGFDPAAAENPSFAGMAKSGGVVESESKIDPDFALTAPVNNRNGKTSWVSAIRDALNILGRGVSHSQLINFVRQSNPELSLGNNKNFYNAISRLVDRGEVIKRDGLLYSSAVEIMEVSNPAGASLESQRRGGAADIVISVLRAVSEGMTAAEIRDVAGGMPSAPRSLREHGQYIYTILAGLKEAGVIEKEGSRYKLLGAAHE